MTEDVFGGSEHGLHIPTRRAFLSSTLAAAVVGSAGCRRKRSPEGQDPPENADSPDDSGSQGGRSGWAPDPTLARELGPVTEVTGFTVRPPRSFAFTYWADDGLIAPKRQAMWATPKPADPKVLYRDSKLFLHVVPAPPLTAGEYVKAWVKLYKDMWTPDAAAVVGEVNGMNVHRQTFSRRGGDGQLYSLLQAGIDGTALVALIGWSIAADAEHVIRVIQQACLTVRRYQGGPVKLFQIAGTTGGKPVVARERIIGGDSAPEVFEDKGPAGAILVGFDYGLETLVNNSVVALRPIYRLRGEDQPGRLRGSQSAALTRVVAEPGYAVGTLRVAFGVFLPGFRLRFMKVVGRDLDPSQSYESAWIGDSQEGLKPLEPIGDATPLVGIRGVEVAGRTAGIGFVYPGE